jgi:hypothetical protein
VNAPEGVKVRVAFRGPENGGRPYVVVSDQWGNRERALDVDAGAVVALANWLDSVGAVDDALRLRGSLAAQAEAIDAWEGRVLAQVGRAREARRALEEAT